jgi:DUF4097 and DUF4098 domain-containing protein YvlB
MKSAVPVVLVAVTLLVRPAAAAQEPPVGTRATTEQTVPLPRDGRIELSDCAGSLVVRAWSREAVQVQARHSRRVSVDIAIRDRVLVIDSRPGHDAVDYTLTVPAAVSLNVEGIACDTDLEGLTGDVQVNTIEGDVHLRELTGHTTAATVEGEIVVEGGRARLQLSTVEGQLRISGAAGEISASSVDGDIAISGSTASALEASTVDGNISFAGSLQNNGRYLLTTHDGDITLTLPENTSATLGVRTFDGELDSSLPLSLTSDGGPGRRRRVFTLGGGSAQVELETFDGDILIRR